MAGTEGQQQLGHLGFLLEASERIHPGSLKVIWDNVLAHREEAMQENLGMPDLKLQRVNLPGYSPDFNADEATRGRAKEEAKGNLCLGSKGAVQERVGRFLAGLALRKGEVRRRCRTVLQSRADAFLGDYRPDSPFHANSHPTLAFV